MMYHNENDYAPFANEEFVIVSPFRSTEENKKALATAEISDSQMKRELELLKVCDEYQKSGKYSRKFAE